MGLDLPTDIPWDQTCATEDMVAAAACEPDHPPMWRSSIAVANYVPGDEYQVYAGRRITYLKVTCTITGYQPRDKQVEGRLNLPGMSVRTIDHIDSILDSYLPCTGALIQVAVSPKGSNVPVVDYPYLMDFQPKKRELYEMVTATDERPSWSFESLKVGRAPGTTNSQEVLDLDQAASETKSIGALSPTIRSSTDESLERRETESHTTQLSQTQHLLNSYHQGTNRAIFFVQPRPHLLDVSTGFVRGPRWGGRDSGVLPDRQPTERSGGLRDLGAARHGPPDHDTDHGLRSLPKRRHLLQGYG